MLAMIQAGWVVYRDNGRYRLTVDLHDKTLYDLVMAVDHDLRLDTHVAIGPLWGSDAADAVPNAILVDDNLGRIMTIILQSIALVYLTETPKDNQ
ncbi:hypothetical protein FACS1894159_07990 [Bacteroidia bacterium]|nr:hypothetical protein FACS1894159_07990 [Bacteroidia bacterium]